MKKLKQILFALIIVIVVGVIGYKLFEEVSYKDSKKEQVKDESGKVVSYTGNYQELLQKEFDKAKSYKVFEFKQDNIYDLVHWMSNPVIKAKQGKKIGFIEPSPDNIYKLKTILEKTKIPHRDFFLENLKNWEKGKFTNVEDIHNTAWKMLDGSIGRANGEDKAEINNLKEKYYK